VVTASHWALIRADDGPALVGVCEFLGLVARLLGVDIGGSTSFGYLLRHLVAIAAMFSQDFGCGLLVGMWLSLSLSNPVLRSRLSCDYRRYRALRSESHQTGDQDCPHQDRDRTRGLPQSVVVGRMTATPSKGTLSGRICWRPSHIGWLDQILIQVSISDHCRDLMTIKNVKASFVLQENDEG
jgi:hypothetical protein